MGALPLISDWLLKLAAKGVKLPAALVLLLSQRKTNP